MQAGDRECVFKVVGIAGGGDKWTEFAAQHTAATRAEALG